MTLTVVSLTQVDFCGKRSFVCFDCVNSLVMLSS